MMKRLIAFLLCLMLLLGTAYGEEAATETDAPVVIGRLPDEQLITYYDGATFVGDSIIRAFRNYVADVVQQEHPTYFQGTKFYGVINYNLYTASLLRPPKDGVNLTYKGSKVSLVQLAEKTKPEKLFILLGLNDYIGNKIEKGMTYVEKIITRVGDVSPDTQVYFFSLTPVTSSALYKAPNRQNKWDAYNVALEQKCAELGGVYVDIATDLKGEDGLLPKEISHDGMFHLNNEGNAIWLQTLLNFAQSEYEAGRWTPAAPAQEE